MEPARTEIAKEAEEPTGVTTTTTDSLFPVVLPPASDADINNSSHPPAHWLSNRSFAADLSAISVAASSPHYPLRLLDSDSDSESESESEDKEKETEINDTTRPPPTYQLLESSSSDLDSNENRDTDKQTKKKKKRKRKISSSSGDAARSKTSRDYDATSRKPNVSSWVPSSSSSGAKPTSKDYYFESRGDRDNLAFGCLYRMDVARYKLQNSLKSYKLNSEALYRWNRRSLVFDGDADIDALDTKLKSSGRYWSAKYSAVERHKNLKRIRVIVPKKSSITVPSDFIPLLDDQTSGKGVDGGSLSRTSVVEESWEDEVLNKTREFNKMSREHPQDEKVWIAFAEFQDKVASMQPQKGARLQTLEKKISILEKATELNPYNEELLLCLLNAYQRRDSADVFIGRWEKILMQHSGSYKLWKEFLHVAQGEFSMFKVSEMRKFYANAHQALSAACSRQYRQVHQTANAPSLDPAIVQQELGLVDIFLSLCRFEWQAGYQELATALFQAELEYSLFCPSLLLTGQSKHRLFEHFWNSNGARIGEDGALGWTTWLGKEEEERQKVISEESSNENEDGGWTGWSQPLSKSKDVSANPENIVDDDVALEEFDEELETRTVEQQDDTEALLKMLGIDADTDPNSEVKDTATWTRWSEEELSRDSDQWMPARAKCGLSLSLVSSFKVYFVSFSQLQHSSVFDASKFPLIVISLKMCERLCSPSPPRTDPTLNSAQVHKPQFFTLRSNFISGSSPIPATTTITFEFIPTSGATTALKYSPSTFTFYFFSIVETTTTTITETTTSLTRRSIVSTSFKGLPCISIFCGLVPSKETIVTAEGTFIIGQISIKPTFVFPNWYRYCKNVFQSRRFCDSYRLGGGGCAAAVDAPSSDRPPPTVADDEPSLPSGRMDLRSNTSLLYFWYAEMEMDNSSGSVSESLLRAIHILCCFGSGVKYTAFKCQPSNLQQLRARQGFKERIRIQRSTWARGVIDDHSIALICSAALFEELTAGCVAGIDVLKQAFSMVLPERRSQSYQLEFLFNYYVRMLRRHHVELRLSEVWESVVQGLQIYPYSPELYDALVEISHLHTASNKLRWMFDTYCQKNPSVIVWLFALSYEMSRGGSQHRIRGLFERALGNEKLCNSVLLWRCYIAYEINVECNPSAARRIFFRAIHACPWSKKLWLDGFLKLHGVLSAKELSDLQEVMQGKELNLRTDVYEILLQDEIQI
ncbi:protein NRDE2 homolog [Camellia sinensis]|nr:protein NRDE2 homolog [Camellia sinensis]